MVRGEGGDGAKGRPTTKNVADVDSAQPMRTIRAVAQLLRAAHCGEEV
jgi:hypothetical protein